MGLRDKFELKIVQAEVNRKANISEGLEKDVARRIRKFNKEGKPLIPSDIAHSLATERKFGFNLFVLAQKLGGGFIEKDLEDCAKKLIKSGKWKVEAQDG